MEHANVAVAQIVSGPRLGKGAQGLCQPSQPLKSYSPASARAVPVPRNGMAHVEQG